MKVIGVDPGLRTSGYAVIHFSDRQEHKVLDAGVIKADTNRPLSIRLNQIHDDIDEILKEHQPDIMAIEELYAHYNHPRTAILMGHARGVFLLTANQNKIHVDDYSATRIKKSLVGHGRASKEQMQYAVMQQLNLSSLPTPADVADALAIAMCCINEHQRENLTL